MSSSRHTKKVSLLLLVRSEACIKIWMCHFSRSSSPSLSLWFFAFLFEQELISTSLAANLSVLFGLTRFLRSNLFSNIEYFIWNILPFHLMSSYDQKKEVWSKWGASRKKVLPAFLSSSYCVSPSPVCARGELFWFTWSIFTDNLHFSEKSIVDIIFGKKCTLVFYLGIWEAVFGLEWWMVNQPGNH